ncbi:aromatic ring-hydroxylating dioxygenase subunit alpha [Ramlibacter sp. AW1]|uniref:Aromatic ring-hydroxylating dioxygenase subunit alpha n=1 Tax=Ramlibacter aurantiacus TaxID=2801330 RepID=A0A937D7Z0_9BURK|nr:aromatic ring-hydroxylating dioxygenase subunit alpha [Ramlibacter aurantiacus]MBL0421476.1 aromatic ring-hydroxylating dioxygenase subunit alpha [Ramlibacter aurantiacus]
MSNAYLRNTWYVAGWSDELAGGQLARRLLDQPILFFRRADGAVAALADRCPHRFVPLRMGKRHGDVIECAYHGLRFDASGRCVLSPNNEQIPKAARVRSYPVIERHGLLFVWMGDTDRADAALVPDFGFMDDPAFATTHGYIHGKSGYLLMVDNILDLSHTQYLHADTLGCEALARARSEVVEHERSVDVRRTMRNSIQAPLTAASRGFADRPADAYMDTRWYPPSYLQMETCLAEPGTPRSQGKTSFALHLITPETASTNHYFWANARAFATDDESLSRRIQEGFAHAFEFEDKPILEAQQESMDGADFWSLQPVLLASDAPAVRVRRRLDRMIAEEAGPP